MWYFIFFITFLIFLLFSPLLFLDLTFQLTNSFFGCFHSAVYLICYIPHSDYYNFHTQYFYLVFYHYLYLFHLTISSLFLCNDNFKILFYIGIFYSYLFCLIWYIYTNCSIFFVSYICVVPFTWLLVSVSLSGISYHNW